MKKIVIALCFLLLLTSCTSVESKEEVNLNKEKSFLGYITDENEEMTLLLNAEVYITTANPKYKEALINTAKNDIVKYHKLLDSHHYYLDENNQRINNIKVLNDNIDLGPIQVDPIIIDALYQAIELTNLTNGYFNISLGKLSALYNDKLLPYDSTNTDPDADEINNKVNGIINPQDLKKAIVIDKTNNTVELKSLDYDYELDLGAFSKGYIINKTYNDLLQYNSSFLLTAGSSSIATYVSANENIQWNIAIKQPDSTVDSLLAFNINNGAVSTSGDYENYYFTSDGTRRHHILNPYTGYSENFYRSNTLLSSDAGIIDALSTALFSVKDEDERISIINNIENFYNIDIKYCMVKDGYEVIMNKEFQDSLISAYSSNEIKSIIIE